jgi:hypothetical protein
MQESEKILASNRNAAQEALAAVKQAREEQARARAETQKLREDSDVAWKAAAAEVEAAKHQAEALRKAAEDEYQAHVRRATAEAQAQVYALKEDIKRLVFEKGQKKLEIRTIDEDVAKRRKALDDVKREMAAIAERLKV